jgi:CHAD domain-containing protein
VAVHARDGNPGFDAVKAALDQFADVARNYMRIDDDATLHEFRKACKHVRYIAELAGDTPTAQAVIEHLKNLQDAIGEWHDILTLAGNATQALSASKRSPYIRELREEVAAKHAHAIEVAANTREALLALRDHYEAAGKKSPRSVAKKRSRRTGGAVA